MPNHPHVLVIGASGRFLAQSAVLQGCQVSVIDLFGDADTRQLCGASNRFSVDGNSVSWVRKISALGNLSVINKGINGGAVKAVVPEMASTSFTIVFSGGGENYPEFFGRGFWGASQVASPKESSIKRLLSWVNIESVCQQNQILAPPSLVSNDQAIDTRYTWLRKQIRSGGGLHLQPWVGSDAVDLEAGEYLQQKIDGVTISGCFVAKEDEGGTTTQILGVCQQLANDDSNDFRYRGSLGPVPLDRCDHEEIERVGRLIAAEFSLVGVFGIDFVKSEKGLFLIDINPRIPASAELIERYYRIDRSDFTILGVHLDAVSSCRLPPPMEDFANAVFSKQIVYLQSDLPLTVDETMVESLQSIPFITDIPASGTVIHPSHPLVSVHADAHDQKALELESEDRVKQLNALLSTAVRKHRERDLTADDGTTVVFPSQRRLNRSLGK